MFNSRSDVIKSLLGLIWGYTSTYPVATPLYLVHFSCLLIVAHPVCLEHLAPVINVTYKRMSCRHLATPLSILASRIRVKPHESVVDLFDLTAVLSIAIIIQGGPIKTAHFLRYHIFAATTDIITRFLLKFSEITAENNKRQFF